MGDHSMTLEHIAPPNLPRKESSPQKTELTQKEQEALLRQLSEMQEAKIISLIAVVYDFANNSPVTHLRWQHEGQLYEAWSEADFRYLRTLPNFSADKSRYRLSLLVFSESIEDMEHQRQAAEAHGVKMRLPEIPNLPTTLSGVSEYFVVSDDPDVFEQEAAFIPLDDIHAYYDGNLEKLKQKLANQEAMNDARARYREAHPQSKDTTLTYWIEEK